MSDPTHPEPYKAFTFSEDGSELPEDPLELGDDERAELLVPILQVRVHGPSRTLPLQAVVDSGAPYSLFSCDVMETLGYTKGDLDPFPLGTAGGETTQYVARDSARILVEMPTLARELRVKPRFLDRLHSGIMVLGRGDFFHEYKVTFEQPAGVFWIQPYDGLPIGASESTVGASETP